MKLRVKFHFRELEEVEEGDYEEIEKEIGEEEDDKEKKCSNEEKENQEMHDTAEEKQETKKNKSNLEDDDEEEGVDSRYTMEGYEEEADDSKY